jgi:hypothetical protein
MAIQAISLVSQTLTMAFGVPFTGRKPVPLGPYRPRTNVTGIYTLISELLQGHYPFGPSRSECRPRRASVLSTNLSHLNRKTSRIFSVNRIPRCCVLVLKSARLRSLAPGFEGDLPNSDKSPPASNPSNEFILVRKRIIMTFGRPRHDSVMPACYLWTASFTEARSSLPVLLATSVLLNS